MSTWRASSRSLLWRRYACLLMLCFKLCWDPSTRFPWTWEPTWNKSRRSQRGGEYTKLPNSKWLGQEMPSCKSWKSHFHSQDKELRDVGDWRKNIEDKAGMGGRKKMFESEAWRCWWYSTMIFSLAWIWIKCIHNFAATVQFIIHKNASQNLNCSLELWSVQFVILYRLTVCQNYAFSK